MAERTLDDLRQKQALPLNVKVRLTMERIRQWVNEYGEDGVYVSFSGGKDSTVLLHIVRSMYPNVKAVFCDTGLEYPTVRQFVKKTDNVDILKPKMTFKEVIRKYGYPVIGKEVASAVDGGKKYIAKLKQYRQTDRQR
jgi:3'-phosphoadenosine 5'-phosphosulfate sulfotransferase (PAPS reductase)/FAD synthetase